MTDREAYEYLEPIAEHPTLTGNYCECLKVALSALRERIDSGWVSVKDRLPEEHDSMFARFFGTDKWNNAMFKTLSNEVIVAGVYGDGNEFVAVGMTHDGKWDSPIKITFSTITHWRPLPTLPDNTKV